MKQQTDAEARLARGLELRAKGVPDEAIAARIGMRKDGWLKLVTRARKAGDPRAIQITQAQAHQRHIESLYGRG